MSVTTAARGRDFRVGEVLGRSWRILAGSPLFFLGVPLLIYAAAFAVMFVLAFALAGADVGGAATAVIFLAIVLAVTLNMLGQAVLLVGAFQRLRGEPVRAGAALRQALGRFVPLLGLVLLFGLSLTIVGFISVWVLSAFMSLLGILALVLAPAFFLAIVVLLVMWAVIVPACLAEGLGPIESMIRSAGLTQGHRWKVLGIILLLVIAYVAASEITDAVLAPISPVLSSLAALAWVAAWTAYWNCAVTMMYHDLRVAKEGVDTREIAAVFD